MRPIPLLKECLDYSHEDPEIHYYLGKCYEEMGNLTDAIWHLQLAVQFDPSHDASQLALIRVLDKNGQKNKSIETARLYFQYKKADLNISFTPAVCCFPNTWFPRLN